MNRRIIILLCCLSLVVPFTSCSQALTPTARLATRESAPALSRLLLVKAFQEGENQRLSLQSIDPISLTDLPASMPLDLGSHYIHTVSPDGATLALVVWPTQEWGGGVLHLVDLDSWQDRTTGLELNDLLLGFTFSEDGKYLYWTQPYRHEGAHIIPRDYQLARYELSSGTLSVIANLPDFFIPYFDERRLFASGARAAIFGVPTGHGTFLAIDAPQVVIVDLESGRRVADVQLEGVKAGQFRERVANQTRYEMYSPGLAWDLERRLLYIVHANEDKVTLVDLAQGRIVKQVEIRPRQSWLDDFLNALVPVADAKMQPESQKRAMLSPDGKRLYVVGQHSKRGIARTTELRIIATDDLREIAHLDELFTDFVLTPDDKSLLLIPARIEQPYGFDAIVNREVLVLDAVTLQTRAALQIGGDTLWFQGSSPDNRYVYLSQSSARWIEGEGWREWTTTLVVLDTSAQRLVAEREFKDSFAELISTTPR